jgi:hypothetical protein
LGLLSHEVERARRSKAHLLALNRLWDIASSDLLREALGHRRLAHAGLADQAGVVLGAAAQDLQAWRRSSVRSRLPHAA